MGTGGNIYALRYLYGDTNEYTTYAYIAIESNTVYLDPVEVITDENTQRIKELGLTERDLISGYYVNNEVEENISYILSGNTVYRFMDHGQLYADNSEQLYETTSLEEFLTGSCYTVNANRGTEIPTGQIPYLVEISGTTVISITEDPAYTF